MHFQLFTLFPEMFPGTLGCSLAGRALASGGWGYNTVNIRDYAKDKHKTVDDTPYGGGAGMVMRADVLGSAIENNHVSGNRLIYMSPRGKIITQDYIYELANCKNISIICGRFEGVDERLISKFAVEELSIGDYILSGGEVAALTLMDACIRLLPGTIGNSGTLLEESFGHNADYAGLLEYPLYTRPLNWNGLAVPEVLLSGHHANVAAWRLQQAKELTKHRRPDLWQKFLQFMADKT